MSRRRIKDGIFIPVLPDGTIAGGGGLTRANDQPKVYTTERPAIRKAGPGGMVLHVTEFSVKQIWP